MCDKKIYTHNSCHCSRAFTKAGQKSWNEASNFKLLLICSSTSYITIECDFPCPKSPDSQHMGEDKVCVMSSITMYNMFVFIVTYIILNYN